MTKQLNTGTVPLEQLGLKCLSQGHNMDGRLWEKQPFSHQNPNGRNCGDTCSWFAVFPQTSKGHLFSLIVLERNDHNWSYFPAGQEQIQCFPFFSKCNIQSHFSSIILLYTVSFHKLLFE